MKKYKTIGVRCPYPPMFFGISSKVMLLNTKLRGPQEKESTKLKLKIV
jgi:hypothetical protein